MRSIHNSIHDKRQAGLEFKHELRNEGSVLRSLLTRLWQIILENCFGQGKQPNCPSPPRA